MAGLRASFGVPSAWRWFVPVTAAVAGMGVALVGTPAVADAGPPAKAAAPVPAAPVEAAADEPLTAPDMASAKVIARLEDEPVEVLGERTESGSVFALPDGTAAAGQGSGPVWVRQGGDGTKPEDWAPVDLTLVARDDGTVGPVAQSGDLAFSGGTAANAATVDAAVVTEPMTGAVTRVQWDGPLPKPRLDGRRATYDDVQPGVDLVLEATSTGFEQFFVIDERPAAGVTPELPLTVVTEGAELTTAEDGGLAVAAGGEVVAQAPAAHMWDAQTDQGRAFPITEARPDEQEDAALLAPMPAWVLSKDHKPASSGKSSKERVDPETDVAAEPVVGDGAVDVAAGLVEVERTVEQPAVDTAEVNLTPQDSFLQDPATTYPVVVDPDLNFAWGFDTYVLKGYGGDRSGNGDLQVGTYDGGAHVGRAFIHFPMGQFAGKQVLGARLELFNWYSWSCQARNWQVWNVYPASPATTWANQPGWATHYSTSSETHGYSGSCPGGWSNADITQFARDWAQYGETEGHVGIKAENEADNYGWKKFYAANNGAYVPSIWVTYNSAPTAPTGLQISGAPNGAVSGAWTRTATPRLSATLGDPDYENVDGNFYLYSYNDGGALIWSKASGFVANGAVASVDVPAGLLKEDWTYYWTARGSDWKLEGPPAGHFWFRVDTISPAAPTVTSAAFPSDGTWNGTPGQPGSFTIQMPTDPSLSAYRWALDKAPDPAQQVTVASGAAATLPVTPAEAGRHVLQVQSVDLAGNVSGITKYAFRVGQAGIVGPDEGAQVVRRVRIAVEAKSALKYVSFEWRRGPDSPAADVLPVPLATLTTSAGKPWTSTWQALPTGSSYTTWDVGSMLGFLGGPVQVRAQLSESSAGTSPTATQWVTVMVDPDADGAATTAIGPGAVNLLTGDHQLSVTDAEEFGISLVRTASSRDTDSGLQLQADALTKDQHEGNSAAGMTGSATASVDTTRHHTGASSIRVSGAAGTVDSYVSVGGDVGGMRLGMKAGRTYRVSGWIFVPKATTLTPGSPRGLALNVFTRVGSGAYSEPSANGAITERPKVDNAWQRISVDVTIPVGATEAFLRLYNGFADPSKTVYFDDISVNEVWSPFGPEWALGTTDAASGTAYTRITRPYDDVASLQLTGGGEVWFTSGDGVNWWPEPGAESLKLRPNGATGWRLTEIDGTVTDFQKNAASNDFPIAVTSPPAATGVARYVYDIGTDPGISRLSRIIAPIEPGVDSWPTNTQACTTATPARGCEVMDLEYASTTTAVGNAVGNYAGRVSKAHVWTWDGTAMVRVAVAWYAYDAAGRLRQVHDPRIPEAGAPALVTVYDYDSAGRIKTVTAPGELPYTYTYGAGGSTKTGAGDFIDSAPGRLLTVTRPSLVQGSASTAGPDNTTTVVYGVPLTRAAGGPYDLDADTIATWAQVDGPTDATAVFGPLNPPGVTTATATTPGANGYKTATVSYLNASGLEVNTASPAALDAPAEGFIDTAEYDRRGNVIRTLDATNRLLALQKLPGAAASLSAWGLSGTSATLAQLLDSRSTYSEDGLDLVSTLAPAQMLGVGDLGDRRLLRATTTNVYDEGKPDGVAYHLVTRTTSAGTDPSTGTVYDALVTTHEYDPIDGASPTGATSGWKHGQPTRVTVDAGQPAAALTSTVVYDSAGRAVRSSKPGSSGTDAASTISVFYTAGVNTADAACGNRPEWAGQPCVTKAAGAITLGSVVTGELPTKRNDAYNKFGSPTVVTDYVGSGADQVKRTATTVYDAADRVRSVSISGTGTGVGAAVATTTTTYDPITGDVTKNASVDSSGAQTSAITKEYDQLGRLTKYTDADGGWTKTEYDRLGQPVKVTDSIGTTRTYEYAAPSVDPRGLLAKYTDSVGGTITPTWGPDGQLESETLPGGVKLTLTYDTARVPVARTYTRASDGAVIFTDSVVENHRGQWLTHTSTTGVRDYTYDPLGRLVGVNDASVTTGTCTSRSYGFDNHTNRTSFTTATAATCPGTTGAPAATSTYDSADRLVATSGANGSAWTYDKLGRITAMPTGDGTKVATTGYFVNDLVAAQEVPGTERTTWGLDPVQRLSKQNTFAWVNNAWANSTETVNHYDGDSDEPAWIVEDATLPDRLTRYVEGTDGAVAVQTGKTGERVLQLVDLHGDIVGTLPIADGSTAATWTSLQLTSFDEFGVPQPMTSGQTGQAPPRYGWLGAAQRSADTPTGAILMGVRLYNATIGRFLQPDPVAGGSANTYDYCNADPVNCTDLGGTFTWKGLVKAIAVVGEVASWIPGPIGAAAAAVSAVAYVASGNKGKALEMTLTAAAGLVGAGAGVRAGFKVASIAAKAGQRSAKAVAKVERAAARAGRACSFVAGTLVRMADGTASPIEALEIGDEILGADPETGALLTEVVIEPLRSRGEKHLVALQFEGAAEAVVATSNHPYWVVGAGWVTAGDLPVGASVLSSDGQPLALTLSTDLGAFADQAVYNLHASGTHTYFVTGSDKARDQLVHNAGGAAACSLGQRGEAAVAARTGLTKNTTGISVGGRTRIPDFIGVNIHEVKNVKRLSNTRQIRDYVSIASSRGQKLVVWVNPTTRVSGPLRRNPGVRIVRTRM